MWMGSDLSCNQLWGGCSISGQLEELLLLQHKPEPQCTELQWPPSAPSLFPALTSFLGAVLSMRINKVYRGISLCCLPHWQFYSRWVWAIVMVFKTSTAIPKKKKNLTLSGSHIWECEISHRAMTECFIDTPAFSLAPADSISQDIPC